MLDVLDSSDSSSSSPDALHVALGECVADRVDAIESECAAATIINTAELVIVQAAGTTFRLGKWRTAGILLDESKHSGLTSLKSTAASW